MLKLIRDMWQEIAFLATLAGGFWYSLEPPITGSIGVISGFVCAFVLAAALMVRAILQQWGMQTRIQIAVLVLSGLLLITSVPIFVVYVVDRSNLILEFEHGGETVEIVRGTEYQPDVLKVKASESMTDSDLLDSAGGPSGRDLVWTREAISKAESRLTVGYVLSFLFTLVSTVFIVEVFRVWRGHVSRRARTPSDD